MTGYRVQMDKATAVYVKTAVRDNVHKRIVGHRYNELSGQLGYNIRQLHRVAWRKG